MSTFVKRREWPIGLVVSVGLHAILFAVLITVKVVQYIMEPPADFKAPAAQAYVVQQPKETKERIKKNQQSGGGGRPPKVAIAVDRPSTFVVPKVDVQISSLHGKLGSRGSGRGIGDGNGDGQGPGSGFGTGGGSGGFGRLGASLFGYTQGLDTDMKGTFWDLKQNRDAKGNGMDLPKYTSELEKFLNGSWNISELNEYFKAPKTLYLTHLSIPDCPADAAPAAYGVADKVQARMWIAYYDGYIEAPEAGQWRFIGMGDDVLVVKLGTRVVLDASWAGWKPSGWKGSGDKENRKWPLGNNTAEIGSWVTMEPGKPQRLQIVVGERPGGRFCQFLCIEKKGQDVPKASDGRPIWDLFKVDELSEEEKKTLQALGANQKVGLNGPLFKAQTAIK